MRERDGHAHRSVRQRHERQHVERTDPRVRAAMRPQVDAITRHPRQRDRGGDDVRRAPDRRDDAAVVDRVARAVHDLRTRGSHRFDARVDHARIAPFADVRNDLEPKASHDATVRVASLERDPHRRAEIFRAFGADQA